MRKQILIITTLLCVVGLTVACNHGDDVYRFKSPVEEYLPYFHNNIIGKWKLIAMYSNQEHFPVENDKYIEFTKIGNNKYGLFQSNMHPEEAYYILTMMGLCFYYSFDSLYKSSKIGGWDYLFLDAGIAYNNPYNPFDTLRLYSRDGWFGDNSIYTNYCFIRMEDE